LSGRGGSHTNGPPPPRGALTCKKKETNVTGQTPIAGGPERPSKPTFKTSPNRRRLYARAVVWTVWLSAGAVFLPRLMF
jgi:hypothetical protein